jgi:transposase-like protein
VTGHGTKFGRKHEEAIAALLTQRNIEEAAKSVGIAPNTLLNWLKVPEFQKAYREARHAAYSQAVAANVRVADHPTGAVSGSPTVRPERFSQEDNTTASRGIDGSICHQRA